MSVAAPSCARTRTIARTAAPPVMKELAYRPRRAPRRRRGDDGLRERGRLARSWGLGRLQSAPPVPDAGGTPALLCSMSVSPLLEVNGLTRRFGTRVAVREVSLE